MREFEWGEEAVLPLSPGFVLQTVRTGLNVPNNVFVLAGPPEVSLNELNFLVLAKMSGYSAIVFRFKDFLH